MRLSELSKRDRDYLNFAFGSSPEGFVANNCRCDDCAALRRLASGESIVLREHDVFARLPDAGWVTIEEAP